MSQRSGIVQPDIFNYKSPDPVFVYGEALASFGLDVGYATNGFGAVTRGFLWQKHDFWFDPQYYENLSTSWGPWWGASVTTTWSAAAGASIVPTVWMTLKFGFNGDFFLNA